MAIGNDSGGRSKSEAQQEVLRAKITQFMIALMIIGSIGALVVGVMITNP